METLGDANGLFYGIKRRENYLGDTIWNQSTDNILADFKLEVIVMNTGRVELLESKGGIIMSKEEKNKFLCRLRGRY